ncbi:MAG: right-handed parallel beta-helix repeat-containing protein, partial [Candidatus Aenigmarchaeota archaeon]|nr:right-handed parallel beta-helix repeat-containing protein [Candidatus Aenigmarchaeota archaeon]
NGTEAFTNLTDAQGNIERQILTEYIHTPSGMDYTDYNNYTVNANLSGYTNATQEINLTESKSVYLTLGPACGILDTADKVYILTQNISSDGTCFIIAANNITIDGAGYTINYSQTSSGHGLTTNGAYSNITVRDCNIVTGSTSASNSIDNVYGVQNWNITNNTIIITSPAAQVYGISTVFSNSTITHNTIQGTGSNAAGIYIYNSGNNNTISHNTVDVEYKALYLSLSSENTVDNNTLISTNAAILVVLHIYNTASDNIITNNNITSTLSGSVWAVYLQGLTNNNIFINNTINTLNSNTFNYYLNFANNNTFINSVINKDANAHDFYVSDDNHGYSNYIVNTTLDKITFSGPSVTDKFYIQWYLDVYVNDTAGSPVENANVTAWQSNGTEAFTKLTDAQGNIERQILTEYMHNYTAKYYTDYNNYTVNATKNSVTATEEVNLTESKSISLTLAGVDACNTLSTPDTTYTLLGNVSSDGTCFSIGANNITIDCDGYTINYSQSTVGYGVYNIDGYDDTKIENCNLILGNTSLSYAYAIFMHSYSEGQINNNTIETEGSYNYGIYIRGPSANNTISNNTVSTDGFYGVGIYLSSFSGNPTYNNITGNILTGIGTFAHGIYLFYAHNNSVLNNTILNTSTISQIHGIYLSDSDDNNVSENNIEMKCSNGAGIMVFSSSSGNNIDDNTITTSNAVCYGIWVNIASSNQLSRNTILTSASSNGHGLLITNSDNIDIISSTINASNDEDIKLETGSNNIAFINTTYSDETISSGDLKRMWYLDVYVNDSVGGAVESANVTAWQNNGTESFTYLTGASGNIQRQILTEYVQSGATKDYTNYSNYTVNATKGSAESTAEVNITGNKAIYITMSGVMVCGTPASADTVYTLVQNVSSDGTCFTIGANNITIDCDGYTINYSKVSTGYAIHNTGHDDITIKNCIIIQGDTSTEDSHAILFLSTALYGVIQNNTIDTYGESCRGIYTTSQSHNTTILNNTISTRDYDSPGISIFNSDNSTIQNNTINTESGIMAFAYGIELWTANNNLIIENNITTNGNAADGIQSLNGENTTIRGNTIVTNNPGATGARGITASDINTYIINNTVSTHGQDAQGLFLGADNMIVTSVTVDASYSNVPDVYISTGDTNITLINVTYSDIEY